MVTHFQRCTKTCRVFHLLVMVSQGHVLPEHAITDEKDYHVADISPSMTRAAYPL